MRIGLYAGIIVLLSCVLLGLGLKSYVKNVVRNPLVVAMWSPPAGDFWHVWLATPFKGAWESLDGRVERRETKGFLYGPVLHFLFFPFLFLKSVHAAGVGILIVYNILFLSTFLIWYGILFKPHPFSLAAFLILFTLWSTFAPIKWVFVEFCPEILEMFFISLSLFFLLKKRNVGSGISMGIAAMTKYLPLIFLPYFLIKKEFKAFWSMVVTLIVIAIATQIVFGWENNNGTLIKPFNTYFRNQVLNIVISKLFSNYGFTHAKILYPTAALVTNLIVHAILLFFLCFAFYKNRALRNPIFEFALLSTWMISFSPHSHMYYLCFLVFPFSIMLFFLLSPEIVFSQKIKIGLLCLLPYILSSFIFMYLEWREYFLEAPFSKSYWDNFHLFLTLTIPGWGLALIFFILIWIYWNVENQKSLFYEAYQKLSNCASLTQG